MKFKQFILSLILFIFLINSIKCQKNSTKSKSMKLNKGTKKTITNSKESAPAYTFAAWDTHRGKICLLVKLDATFKISYDTSYGKQTLITRIPMDAQMDGRCSNVLDQNAVMDITWGKGFMFRIVFEKYIDSETWSVKRMEFVYDTSNNLFDGAIGGSQKIAKGEGVVSQLFETSVGKSYFCPSPDVITLSDSETGENTVYVRLENVQMQPFDLNNAAFSPVYRCDQISFGLGVSSPFALQSGESDGVQIQVFTMLIIADIGTVLGYALYRSYFIKKFDYDEQAI